MTVDDFKNEIVIELENLSRWNRIRPWQKY